MKFRMLVFSSLSVLSFFLFFTTTRATGSKASQELDRGFLDSRIVARSASDTAVVSTLDGHEVPMALAGAWKSSRSLQVLNARPLSLASGDFDEDGVPDLVAGYSTDTGGLIALMRGDGDSIFPNTKDAVEHRAALASQRPAPDSVSSPFLLSTSVTAVNEQPEMLVAGDFDADGHLDIATSQPGDTAFSFLRGDGHGNFAASRPIALPGRITTMLAADIDRIDGLTDLLVGLDTKSGPMVAVLESEEGVVNAAPELIGLPAIATSIAAGHLDGNYTVDFVVAAGRDVVIVNGCDRLRSRSEQRVTVTISHTFFVWDVAVGDFTSDDRNEIALIGDDLSLHLLARDEAAKGSQPWTETQTVPIPFPSPKQSNLDVCLLTTRMSSSPKDDLVLFSKAASRFFVLVNESSLSAVDARIASASAGIRIAASFDLDADPTAILPMRLNVDALSDLIVLRVGQDLPAVILTAPASTFVVTNTNDSGPGSLRQAINDANGAVGADAITFNIGGSGIQTIALLSPLPGASGAITVDGTTQNPGSLTPQIQLNGAGAGDNATGLSFSGGNSVVRGLVINRFDSLGISLVGPSNDFVEGCFIGTDASGTFAQGNADSGVAVSNGSNKVIGGTTSAARNVIAGNFTHGVLLLSGANNNFVRGNYIGVSAGGASAVGNSGDGISLVSAGANNVIGGAAAGAGNVISANSGVGVRLFGIGAGNLVQGNLIGTDSSGSFRLGNGVNGVDIFDSAGNTVGGSTPAARNVISANEGNGVRINASGAVGNFVRGNFIGTAADGSSSLFNRSDGVVLINNPTANVVGGVAAGEPNTIAFNNGAGVLVQSGSGNSVLSNSIFSNTGLGIDLSPSGVTPNDVGDGDLGANNLQNFPVLTVAGSATGGGGTIQGTLNSTPSSAFTIQFFANSICDPTGNGEGQTFLGSTSVTTNASGNASFNVALPAGAPAGTFITATSTNATGDTSEYSACRIFGIADLSVSQTAGPNPVASGGNVTFTINVVNNGPDAASSVTVADLLPASTAFVSCSSTGGGVCSGTGNNRSVTFSSMSAGGSATVTIVAQTSCALASGTIVSNTATASAATSDLVSANNSATASTTTQVVPPTIDPASETFAQPGGQGSISINLPSGCAWTAISNAAWITMVTGGGTGPGGAGYNIATNLTGSPRTGNITAAGLTFTVNQTSSPCGYSLSPASASFPTSGGSGSVNVGTQHACDWTTSTAASWINITSAPSNSGTGTVNYTVASNSGTPRTGKITIAGQDFSINQPGCSYSMNLLSKYFPAAGGSDSLSVAAAAGCGWSVTASQSWIVITSGGKGNGNGVTSFMVQPNLDAAPRQGSIDLPGQSFLIVQDSQVSPNCALAIASSIGTIPASGGGGAINVTTPERCVWHASSDVGWITISSVDAGIGNGTFTIAVAANPGPLARKGTVTISGQTLTIKQRAP
jgi:uncharacterized repeat protein (TIGR01451 family)